MTATVRAYEELREWILNGTLQQGSRIREGDISAQLSLSRTPVREALKLLSAEGFVNFEPNKGVTVAIWSERRIADAYTVRATLESLAASLSAINATPESIAHMFELCDEMDSLLSHEGNPPVATIASLNGKFHDLIAASAGNEIATELIRKLAQVPSHRTFETYSPADLRRSFGDHRQLATAIQMRDPMAAEAMMKVHILAGRARHATPAPGSTNGR
jgi:DNA-binding GntR family transcriptional regulator